MTKGARHWAINGRFLAQPVTGVQRYAREVVAALDARIAAGDPLARNLTVELLTPPDRRDELALAAIRTRVIGDFGGHGWEQAVLPFGVRGGLISLCNSGPLVTARQILCIHDLNTRACPQSYSLPFRLLYRTLIPALARRVRHVTTVSGYSAGQLVRHGLCEADKITIAPDGYEHALRWTPRHSIRTHSTASAGTIVLLGSRAPHKNINIVLGMGDRLAAAGLRVVVVGLSDGRVFGKREEQAGANIGWLGRIGDDELAALLGDSLCLAFPSLVEGFGLPMLEAMVRGCPVVASDRASLPEIGGDAVLYAPPDRADIWFDRFMQLAGDAALRRMMIVRGRRQAEKFSWDETAKRYLELMARTDGIPIAATRSPARPSLVSATTRSKL
ncbi:glycosyltransferase family 4 protein [Aquamicrobium ahrensii]|uniref:Glycosyltransferase involved in cell wall biosynthesis n=1 Tax=Aquamicrobium ahrensii TaxID=469551 RepID=A0ABV2KID9_9HYPH